MIFKFEDKKLLEIGKSYDAVVTSVVVMDEDSPKERILLNLSVAGYITPAPISFSTGSEVGCRLLNELMIRLGVKDINALVGKVVTIKLDVRNGYTNTTIVNKTVVVSEIANPFMK